MKTKYVGYRDIYDMNMERISKKFNFFFNILNSFADTIKANKDEISISVQCLSDIILSVETDLQRQKYFHPINHVSAGREISLYCYYILRRKPIVFANNDENSDLSMYINERFCVALILSNFELDKVDYIKLSEYRDFLFYFFSNREYSKDSLYLLTKTLEMTLYKEGNKDV